MSQREGFEKWASDDYKYPNFIEKENGHYKLFAAQHYWVAWQAAKAAQEQCEPVIWTHQSSLADSKPWTAMLLNSGECPYAKLAEQQYGDTQIEAIPKLLGIKQQGEPISYTSAYWVDKLRNLKNGYHCEVPTWKAKESEHDIPLHTVHHPRIPPEMIAEIEALKDTGHPDFYVNDFRTGFNRALEIVLKIIKECAG